MMDTETINGYDIDALARSLYDARSQGAPISDERWERHVTLFAGTHRRLLDEARRIAEE